MVMDGGRGARVTSAARRRALRVRDKGCRFPGCDRPVNWTSAHHIIFWARGGLNEVANEVLLWGLLPNSLKLATIEVPSFLDYVSAGGAALDGVQSGRAEALPQLLARRSRAGKAHRSTPGRSCRFRIRTQPGQQALQPYWPTIGRPRGPVQALAARLSLQHSERASTLRGGFAKPGLALVLGLRTRRSTSRPQRADQASQTFRYSGLRTLFPTHCSTLRGPRPGAG